MSSHPNEEPDLEQQEEWLGQLNLIYVGLIGVGLVMIQPLITAESLDQSAKICAVAFSVAIPLLAALVLLNRQETYRRRMARPISVEVARSLAQLSAFVGLVAGFWHIYWMAGAGVIAAAVVGTGVHSAGFTRLEVHKPPPKEE